MQSSPTFLLAILSPRRVIGQNFFLIVEKQAVDKKVSSPEQPKRVCFCLESTFSAPRLSHFNRDPRQRDSNLEKK